MATYSDADFRQIAAAIDRRVTDVMKLERLFEAAAHWYSHDLKAPRRPAPSEVRRKLDNIAKSASRLLKHLSIERHEDAADGPSDITILEWLASSRDGNEDAVTSAAERIGRLVEITEATEATNDLEARASQAAEDVLKLGKLIVPKGHQGDAAVNNWIAAMMRLYKKVTGSDPGTSVGAPGRPNEGVAGGPFIRFLSAAGKPLGIKYSSEAWRSRVRTILDSLPNQN